MSWLARNRVFFFVLVVFLISGTTYFLIQIARGYRFDPTEKGLKAHGLLALKSRPDGAKIYINGVFREATDATVALTPGLYQINVEKNDFHPWSKLLTINRELVTQSDIFLFPMVPNLQPLTYDGASMPTISPDCSKIAYLSPVSITGATGVWVYEVGGGLIDFNRSPRLVLNDLASLIPLNNLSLSWSPDNKWVIAKNTATKTVFLINPSQTNTNTEVINRNTNYLSYQKDWEENASVQQNLGLSKLPREMVAILNASAQNLSFSPDSLKVLYTASASATIPSNLTTSPPTASTQKESRKITPSNYYVYDYKEDRNFKIPYSPPTLPTETPAKNQITPENTTTTQPPQWLPSSNHLFWVEETEGTYGIWVSEYDGTNKTRVYNGNFDPGSVFTSPTMGKLIILSNFGIDPTVKLANLFNLDLLH